MSEASLSTCVEEALSLLWAVNLEETWLIISEDPLFTCAVEAFSLQACLIMFAARCSTNC